MSRLEDLRERIAAREARIGVIGLGYVGLPLAVEFAKAGFPVVGFDVDARKVEKLAAGESYIEDVPSAEVTAAQAAGRLRATADFGELSRCDVINVCVPTPLTKTRDPDVSHMARALDDIRKRVRSGQLIVLGSTTYPGTTHELFVAMLESSGLRVGVDLAVAFAPERIDPGNQRFRVREVPKVVGGETPLCTELAAAVFGAIFERVVRVSSTQSA
jgi:UDP-N-acetyl-D-glucosamine dehydrogenase